MRILDHLFLSTAERHTITIYAILSPLYIFSFVYILYIGPIYYSPLNTWKAKKTVPANKIKL